MMTTVEIIMIVMAMKTIVMRMVLKDVTVLHILSDEDGSEYDDDDVTVLIIFSDEDGNECDDKNDDDMSLYLLYIVMKMAVNVMKMMMVMVSMVMSTQSSPH